jgi:integration host factor subunit beta
MGDNITRADFAKDLANFSGISEGDADQYIKFFLERLADRIAEGEKIELRGFGSFGSKQVKARMRCNPSELRFGDKWDSRKTKKMIPAHRIVFFRAGVALKTAVRDGTEICRNLRKNSRLRLSEWYKKETAERWEKMKEWGYAGFPEKIPDTRPELDAAEKKIFFIVPKEGKRNENGKADKNIPVSEQRRER